MPRASKRTSPQKQADSSAPAEIRTEAALAKFCSTSRPAIDRRKQRGEWPAGVSTSPPWSRAQAEQIRAVVNIGRDGRGGSTPPPETPAATTELGDTSATAIGQARLDETLEKVEKLRMQNEQLRGALVPRVDVRETLMTLAMTIRKALIDAPNQIAGHFIGDVATRVKQISEQVLRAACAGLAEHGAGDATGS